MSASVASTYTRQMLNKVPEVTLYFWIIKILCTTVGESLADYINETLGFGLTNTTILFGAMFVVTLIVQFRLRSYVPGVYWLAVVLVSVVGTLLTDQLTDGQGVPLWISTTVFSVLLAVVFAVWYARERTLSIHSIITRPREAFYWLTVLVTFALGTAAGDWTLELTGWGPGPSVLLPAGLIAAVVAARKLGAGPLVHAWNEPVDIAVDLGPDSLPDLHGTATSMAVHSRPVDALLAGSPDLIVLGTHVDGHLSYLARACLRAATGTVASVPDGPLPSTGRVVVGFAAETHPATRCGGPPMRPDSGGRSSWWYTPGSCTRPPRRSSCGRRGRSPRIATPPRTGYVRGSPASSATPRPR